MWVCAWSRAILRVCFELESCCFTALSITDWLSTCANRHTQKFHAVKKSKRTVLKPNQILWTILCLHLFPKNHTCRHENSQCVHLEKNVTKMCIYEASAIWCIIEDVFFVCKFLHKFVHFDFYYCLYLGTTVFSISTGADYLSVPKPQNCGASHFHPPSTFNTTGQDFSRAHFAAS